MKKFKITSLLISVSSVALSACAPNNFEKLQQIANDTAAAVGCTSFESKTWDAVDNFLIEAKSIPTSVEVRDRLKLALQDVKNSEGSLTEEQKALLAADISELYDIMLTEAVEKEQVQTSEELLKVLTALELGDHTTPTKVALQNKLEVQFAKIENHSKSMRVQCRTPESSGNDDLGSSPIAVNSGGLPLAVFGAHWAMATAYQTCESLTEPPMDRNTPSVQGIVITGKHPDKHGNKREVANVGALLKTHPYYKNVGSYREGCFNMRNSPLIYDYGGKPYVSIKEGSPLNFFKDSGDGTKALGIDCSGFVYSALATAGLRVTPLKNMKATGVYGIGSTMYVEPQYNKLTCLQKISVKPSDSLRAGDIVAVPGHVLMIDSASSDPFGLNSVSTAAGCNSLNVKNFNFVVVQSSSSKLGVGINKYDARDYLPENSKMRAGLERYAYYSCLAKFNNKVYTPNLGTLSVVRHKGTPECLGSRVRLTQESCIESCPQLAR